MPGAAFASSWRAYVAPEMQAWRAALVAPQRHSSVFLPDLATVSSTASCDTSPVTMTFCVGRSRSTFCTPARQARPRLHTRAGPALHAPPRRRRYAVRKGRCLSQAADWLCGEPSRRRICRLARQRRTGRLPVHTTTQQSAHLACFSTRGAQRLRSLHTSCRPSAPPSGPANTVSRWTGSDTPTGAESAQNSSHIRWLPKHAAFRKFCRKRYPMLCLVLRERKHAYHLQQHATAERGTATGPHCHTDTWGH